MSKREILEFDCNGFTLVGILDVGFPESKRAVLVVVGGPQYRVGSHRQFLLVARELATHGFPVLRFDQRGSGDSAGTTTFETLDDDIRSAIDRLQTALPSVREIVIWGLCDAASAALIYGWQDSRVAGLVLLNPWVRSELTLARSYFRNYYHRQLLSREFWRRLKGGQVDVNKAAASLIENIRALFRGGGAVGTHSDSATPSGRPFQERMLEGLGRFEGRVLFVLSGEDLTAREFLELSRSSRAWRKTMKRRTITHYDIAEANHTFSTREWRDRVVQATIGWLRSW